MFYNFAHVFFITKLERNLISIFAAFLLSWQFCCCLSTTKSLFYLIVRFTINNFLLIYYEASEQDQPKCVYAWSKVTAKTSSTYNIH